MYLVPPLRYLFSDQDNKAVGDLLAKIKNKDDEFCKNIAEVSFKQNDIDLAVHAIRNAAKRSPNNKSKRNIYYVYWKSYIIHKIAMKVNNWYAVLGIKDLNAQVDEIQKAYDNLVTSLKNCSSVAAESALRLVDAAWVVLSHPRLREAYDKQLFSASSQFHENVALSSACSSEAE